MTNNESELREPEHGHQLVFYLELLRHNGEPHRLTQGDLAKMSGVDRLRLGRYERARELPRLLKDLIALSYALGLPSVEALIAPEVREAILEEVDQFREKLGFRPLRPSTGPIGFDVGSE